MKKIVGIIILTLGLIGYSSIKGYSQTGVVSVEVLEHIELSIDDNDITFLYDYFDRNPYTTDGPTDRNTITIVANCDWQLNITADAEFFTGPDGISDISIERVTIQDPTGSPYDNPGDIFDLLTRTGHELDELDGVSYQSSFNLTWFFRFGPEPEEMGKYKAGDYVVNTTYSVTSYTPPTPPGP